MRKMMLAALAATMLCGPVQAALLAAGSSFDLFLGETNTRTGGFVQGHDYTLTVGAGPQAFTFGAATGTIASSETDLGGGDYRLLFTVTADRDLFPVFNGSGNSGFVGIGPTDPLKLTAPFTVRSAQLSFLDGQANTIATSRGLPTDADPFDGAYPAIGHIQGFTNIGGRDTQGITLSLTGNRIAAAVPEPASWALMVMGLGTAGFARRRRRAIARVARAA